MDRSELDRQYSPSKWSKRFDAEGVLKEHVEMITKASAEARSTLPCETFRYGSDENQLLDIFGKTLPQSAPLLVHIHGGFWQELDRTISSYIVKPFFEAGIRVAVVGYDLAPKVPLKRIIEEVRELSTFINNYAKENNCEDVWYSGHSAGAHLVATLLNSAFLKSAASDKIRGMILISGVYDLSPIVDTYVNDALQLNREDALLCSVSLRDLKENDVNKISFLIVVGEHESDEFHRQSRYFHEALGKLSEKTTFLFLEGLDHFDIVEKLNSSEYELTNRIIRFIKCE